MFCSILYIYITWLVQQLHHVLPCCAYLQLEKREEKYASPFPKLKSKVINCCKKWCHNSTTPKPQIKGQPLSCDFFRRGFAVLLNTQQHGASGGGRCIGAGSGPARYIFVKYIIGQWYTSPAGDTRSKCWNWYVNISRLSRRHIDKRHSERTTPRLDG